MVQLVLPTDEPTVSTPETTPLIVAKPLLSDMARIRFWPAATSSRVLKEPFCLLESYAISDSLTSAAKQQAISAGNGSRSQTILTVVYS